MWNSIPHLMIPNILFVCPSLLLSAAHSYQRIFYLCCNEPTYQWQNEICCCHINTETVNRTVTSCSSLLFASFTRNLSKVMHKLSAHTYKKSAGLVYWPSTSFVHWTYSLQTGATRTVLHPTKPRCRSRHTSFLYRNSTFLHLQGTWLLA